MQILSISPQTRAVSQTTKGYPIPKLLISLKTVQTGIITLHPSCTFSDCTLFNVLSTLVSPFSTDELTYGQDRAIHMYCLQERLESLLAITFAC